MGGAFHYLGERLEVAGTGPPSLFGLWGLPSELSWRGWVCPLAHAHVLQGACDEAQGPLGVRYSTIWDLAGANQCSSYYDAVFVISHVFQKLCPAPVPPVLVRNASVGLVGGRRDNACIHSCPVSKWAQL